MQATTVVVDYNYASGKTTIHDSQQSAKEFMLNGGSGIYTAMRTVSNGRRVFLFEDHMQRIVNSYKMVLADGQHGNNTVEQWSALLRPLIRRGLNMYAGDGESKITVLVGKCGVHIQLAKLQEPSSASCWVRFIGGKRDHPEAKDLQWVHEREVLERLIVPPINEVVLVDSAEDVQDSRFYEGTSSNFFAVRRLRGQEEQQSTFINYELISAPLDSVLLGTVMKLVLRICEADGIPVRHQPLVELGIWEGAFVTSTSRLVLPVETITYGDDGQMSQKLDAENPLVMHLRERVLNMARERSTEI
ncbi:D-aminoacid aminotransferase-like PLP-dependent enzyme [Coemansia reversa NRRL 1564]|uniref:D-aminoacid aminotransferase-like PLP-dependent enzyme n=1 Tax=Coemansia reversa (strain ATCC 12441 / NRRL 1564) TaxID=763665 RepID=A0A2G5BG36_COERN|nr:D-aminoacid aminotransferase-like PLP-dependent enzyme [Coemansia reversa NRRL 1564]|eukprot:PIA17963.1 D-aminoacid aminotransferase-like PLP-dependent enzyme [Coemansia reversa NRRL 1564]